MAITLETNYSTQQALEKIVAPQSKTQSFRPDDKLLRFPGLAGKSVNKLTYYFGVMFYGVLWQWHAATQSI
jgi:hypothetical protein